jgi:large subunit ribosomal protein L9
MKVILKEEIKSLGQVGAVVNVSDGYARNFLLPRRKAVEATPGNLRVVEAAQHRSEAKQAEALAEVEALAERVRTMSVTIPVQAGEGEKLFGAVTAKDIAEALVNAGVRIEKRMVVLEAPIKQTGETTVTIRLHPSVSVPLRVSVVAEGAEPAPKKGRRKKSA